MESKTSTINMFGDLLRQFRMKCSDPQDPGRKLSQEKLGELLGKELGLRGKYSGAAVSDWERSKSRINADHRRVLVSLIKIYYRLAALQTVVEADQFLEAGNYRALNQAERREVFSEETSDKWSDMSSAPGHHRRSWFFSLEIVFSVFSD